MKKRSVAILTLLVLTLTCVCLFFACNKHEHNFSNEWTITETHHYYACSCGEKQDYEEHEYDSGTVTKTPTETEKGEKTFTCLTCGKVKIQELPDLTSHQHDYSSNVTEPKCGKMGYTTYTCGCGYSYDSDYVDALEHLFTNFVYNNDATCLTDGTESAPCDRDCGADHQRPKANTKLQHSYGAWNIEIPATSTSTGTLGHYQCSGCKRYFDEEYKPIANIAIPKLEYLTIYDRVDVNGNYDENGDYVLFGSYPQTDVTDIMSSTLNALVGLPDTNDAWISYGYYIDNEVVDFMWYIDVVLETEEYRGVYFNQYRPQQLGGFDGDEESSYQDDNGYTVNNVYWFKYEPLKWRILDENTGLLLCESVIDAQEYHLSSDNYKTNREDYLGNTASVYANNYQYSTIRGWLNTTFYQIAFSQLEQSVIKTTEVDNSERSTNPNDNATAFNGGDNIYACDNTFDKVFLLSQQEITNSLYGFNSDPTVYDSARRKIATGYAKCQGVWVTKETSVTEGIGKSDWQLRSPYFERPYSVYSAMGLGISDWSGQIYCLDGVVPVIQIDFENNSHTHDFAVTYTRTETHHYKECICGERISYGTHAWDNGTQTKDPNCTEMGEKTFVCTICTKPKIESIPTKHNFETKYSNNSTHHYFKCEHCSETTEKIAHTFVSGVCVCGREEVKYVTNYDRVNSDGTENEVGDYILFGSYPQTDVTSSMGTTLNAIAGLPDTNDAWIDYGYYAEGEQSEYMWYIDIENGGEKYRGVYFTNYRPHATDDYYQATGDTFQDDYGYIINNVYWFKYEPIKWRILNEDLGLVVSDIILDAQHFYWEDYKGTKTREDYLGNSASVYANNYQYSDIRGWLNTTFYQTAFSEIEKSIIKTTEVDNSERSTNLDSNPTYLNNGVNDYACDNTFDKVFLLSMQELTNSDYKMTSKTMLYSDYSKSQGLDTEDYAGQLERYGGAYLQRSPAHYNGHSVRDVGVDGRLFEYVASVNKSHEGVVPALCLNFSYREQTGDLYQRVDADGNVKKSGTYMLFGSYPQTDVTASMGTTLNAIAGLPSTNSAWVDYGYYIQGSKSEYMWYIDIENGGEKYRGVYFNEYRPSNVTGKAEKSYTYQDDNGYNKNTVYWFKYEPIKWRILTISNNVATLLCEMIIDCQPIQNDKSTLPSGVNESNYEYSTIRSWLNDTFYNTAFSPLQKQIIKLTTVDNSAESTGDTSNQFACNDTQDYVYLLSYKEVKDNNLGFDIPEIEISRRSLQTTNYAQSQGVWVYPYSNASKGDWLLRSPRNFMSMRIVSYSGNVTTSSACPGIVPAVQIQLS